VKKNISKNQRNDISNGILYLKGGDLHDELRGFEHQIKIFEISDFFEEEFFETKKVVYYSR
jgi:16S rRNA (guanine527-N7)-methyltransferase